MPAQPGTCHDWFCECVSLFALSSWGFLLRHRSSCVPSSHPSCARIVVVQGDDGSVDFVSTRRRRWTRPMLEATPYDTQSRSPKTVSWRLALEGCFVQTFLFARPGIAVPTPGIADHCVCFSGLGMWACSLELTFRPSRSRSRSVCCLRGLEATFVRRVRPCFRGSPSETRPPVSAPRSTARGTDGERRRPRRGLGGARGLGERAAPVRGGGPGEPRARGRRVPARERPPTPARGRGRAAEAAASPRGGRG